MVEALSALDAALGPLVRGIFMFGPECKAKNVTVDGEKYVQTIGPTTNVRIDGGVAVLVTTEVVLCRCILHQYSIHLRRKGLSDCFLQNFPTLVVHPFPDLLAIFPHDHMVGVRGSSTRLQRTA